MSRQGKVKGKFSTISLPVKLIERIKKRIKDTGFTSVSSYIEFLARVSIEEIDNKKNPVAIEDKEKVKARLRALGYIE